MPKVVHISLLYL